MKWLIQEMLNNSENVERMRKAVENEHEEYLFVKIEPDESLTVLDSKTRLPLQNSKNVLTTFLSSGNIIGYGSKKLDQIMRQLGVYPGSFSNPNFEMDRLRDEIGNELLNEGYQVGELHELEPKWERFFIRPTGNTKLFGGMTVTNAEFREWKKRESHPTSPYIGQSLMVSELKEIEAEYRFFVVNGSVITGSSYIVNGQRDITKKPPAEIVSYAQHMVNRFSLSTAFVIDIAKVKNGMKIVEYNNFNTSGLYHCNEIEIVRAIRLLNESF